MNHLKKPASCGLSCFWLFTSVYPLSFPAAMQSQPPWRFIASTFGPTPLNWCKRADGKTTQ